MRSLDKSRQNESIVTEIPIYPHLKKITLCLDFFKPQIMFDRSFGLCSYWSLESLILSDLHRHGVGSTFLFNRVFWWIINYQSLCWESASERSIRFQRRTWVMLDKFCIILQYIPFIVLRERFLNFWLCTGCNSLGFVSWSVTDKLHERSIVTISLPQPHLITTSCPGQITDQWPNQFLCIDNCCLEVNPDLPLLEIIVSILLLCKPAEMLIFASALTSSKEVYFSASRNTCSRWAAASSIHAFHLILVTAISFSQILKPISLLLRT